jgi:hypothetical protein
MSSRRAFRLLPLLSQAHAATQQVSGLPAALQAAAGGLAGSSLRPRLLSHTAGFSAQPFVATTERFDTTNSLLQASSHSANALGWHAFLGAAGARSVGSRSAERAAGACPMHGVGLSGRRHLRPLSHSQQIQVLKLRQDLDDESQSKMHIPYSQLLSMIKTRYGDCPLNECKAPGVTCRGARADETTATSPGREAQEPVHNAHAYWSVLGLKHVPMNPISSLAVGQRTMTGRRRTWHRHCTGQAWSCGMAMSYTFGRCVATRPAGRATVPAAYTCSCSVGRPVVAS